MLNAFAFLLLLREVLWPDHRWALALSTLLLAVVYLGAARAVASANRRGAARRACSLPGSR